MRPILLVEDGVYYYGSLRWTLRRSGYCVDCASGAQEALDYLVCADPAGLIFMHCLRPDVDLLARLKDAGQPVVVIMEPGPEPAGADLVLLSPLLGENLLAAARAFYRGWSDDAVRRRRGAK